MKTSEYKYIYKGDRVRVEDFPSAPHVVVRGSDDTLCLIPYMDWINGSRSVPAEPDLDQYTWIANGTEEVGNYLIWSPPACPGRWNLICGAQPAPGYEVCFAPAPPKTR